MATGVPALLLDTCIILDIIRAPIREQIAVQDIAAVHTLLKRATRTPPEVCLIIAEQPQREFLEHFDSIERETAAELKKATERLSGILTRILALSPAQGIPGTIDLQSLGFPATSRQLAEKIVEMSSF